jgi:hypothetical protein
MPLVPGKPLAHMSYKISTKSDTHTGIAGAGVGVDSGCITVMSVFEVHIWIEVVWEVPVAIYLIPVSSAKWKAYALMIFLRESRKFGTY